MWLSWSGIRVAGLSGWVGVVSVLQAEACNTDTFLYHSPIFFRSLRPTFFSFFSHTIDCYFPCNMLSACNSS